MNIVLKLFAVLLFGLLVVACGGNGDDGGNGGNGGNGDGGNGDAAAIESMIREFYSAFEDGDANKLASLFSADCADISDTLAEALDLIGGLGIEFDVTGVDVRNLDGDTAEAAPQGTVSIAGEEEPLGSEEDYNNVVKEDGEWKIADCDFFS